MRNWLFDLDNTLYPFGSGLFDQVRARIGEYMTLHCGVQTHDIESTQRRYRDQYGSSLAGLMAEDLAEPEPFLSFVHDVDYGVINPNPRLADALAKLTGRRIIFTNGSTEHAKNVLNRLGMEDLFEDIFDIARADYVPKPNPAPYERIVRDFDLDVSESVFVEDMARNLAPARALGMTTVLVTTDPNTAAAEADHVTNDLASWLRDAATALS
jgi:putative hydrolase of the HAD superfamily